MVRRRSQRGERRDVLRGGVPLVVRPPVLRMLLGESHHDGVSSRLGEDARGGDRDPPQLGEVLAILRDAGISAILVTHDPEEALRIADRDDLFAFACAVRDEMSRGNRPAKNTGHEDESPSAERAAPFLQTWQEAMGHWSSGNRDTLNNFWTR